MRNASNGVILRRVLPIFYVSYLAVDGKNGSRPVYDLNGLEFGERKAS